MISDLGFLSSEVEEDEKRIIAAYVDLFQLSERLSKLFIGLFRVSELDRTTLNLTLNALALKSLELFQSSIILLRRGCIPAAKITCRSLIETVYKLCAIQLSNESIDLYICQAKWTHLQKLRCIQKYMQKHPGSRIVPGIESEIDRLSKDSPKKTDACTDPCRPPIPIHVAHLFRDMPPTDSARMPPTFLLNPERNQKTV